jgi:predicted membrane protein
VLILSTTWFSTIFSINIFNLIYCLTSLSCFLLVFPVALFLFYIFFSLLNLENYYFFSISKWLCSLYLIVSHTLLWTKIRETIIDSLFDVQFLYQSSILKGESRRFNNKQRARHHLTPQKRQEIKEAFELFDTDGSGFLNTLYHQKHNVDKYFISLSC